MPNAFINGQSGATLGPPRRLIIRGVIVIAAICALVFIKWPDVSPAVHVFHFAFEDLNRDDVLDSLEFLGVETENERNKWTSDAENERPYLRVYVERQPLAPHRFQMQPSPSWLATHVRLNCRFRYRWVGRSGFHGAGAYVSDSSVAWIRHTLSEMKPDLPPDARRSYALLASNGFHDGEYFHWLGVAQIALLGIGGFATIDIIWIVCAPIRRRFRRRKNDHVTPPS